MHSRPPFNLSRNDTGTVQAQYTPCATNWVPKRFRDQVYVSYTVDIIVSVSKVDGEQN